MLKYQYHKLTIHPLLTQPGKDHPIAINNNIHFFAASIENFPLKSVRAIVFEFFTVTVAPASGLPMLSVTMPVTILV